MIFGVQYIILPPLPAYLPYPTKPTIGEYDQESESRSNQARTKSDLWCCPL